MESSLKKKYNYCTECGFKLTSNSKFCGECGEKVEEVTSNLQPQIDNGISNLLPQIEDLKRKKRIQSYKNNIIGSLVLIVCGFFLTKISVQNTYYGMVYTIYPLVGIGELAMVIFGVIALICLFLYFTETRKDVI